MVDVVPTCSDESRQLNSNGPSFQGVKEFSDYALSCDWTSVLTTCLPGSRRKDTTKLFVATADGKVTLWDLNSSNLSQVAQVCRPGTDANC